MIYLADREVFLEKLAIRIFKEELDASYRTDREAGNAARHLLTLGSCTAIRDLSV